MEPTNQEEEEENPPKDIQSPISPPSSEEVSMCPDYVSSYTQISHFNTNDAGDQTDLETSDEEFSDELLQPDPGTNIADNNENKNDSTLPELSSQIVEWSKNAFKSYDDDVDGGVSIENNNGNDNKIDATNIPEEPLSIKSTIPDESDDDNENKLMFFPMKFLQDLEQQTICISQNLQQITNHISEFSSNATSTTVDVMKLYHDNVLDTCDTIDLNIKLMYRIISKAEELNKSLKFLDDLKNKM